MLCCLGNESTSGQVLIATAGMLVLTTLAIILYFRFEKETAKSLSVGSVTTVKLAVVPFVDFAAIQR